MSAATSVGATPTERLGAGGEVALLHELVSQWLGSVDPELRPALEAVFAGTPKSFRPLTLFACHRALHDGPPGHMAIEQAFAMELLHNMSLVVDDILDESTTRRGVPTVERAFGRLPALMASGYLVADAFDVVAETRSRRGCSRSCCAGSASAECLQWRLRRQPLGTEDWRQIAGEDTGSMFEICAVLGARSERLRHVRPLLGMLYHGCDDVGDQRGLEALGGGGDEDIRDGILTLPAALAIRDPRVRALFVRDDEDPDRLVELGEAFRAQLETAEDVLDGIAADACAEARRSASDPSALIALVGEVRQLSTALSAARPPARTPVRAPRRAGRVGSEPPHSSSTARSAVQSWPLARWWMASRSPRAAPAASASCCRAACSACS